MAAVLLAQTAAGSVVTTRGSVVTIRGSVVTTRASVTMRAADVTTSELVRYADFNGGARHIARDWRLLETSTARPDSDRLIV